jgi:protein required for attachment to host cells
MKPIMTWIVVADGARARIVSNSGPGKGLQAVEGMDFRTHTPAGRDIDADRPGRTHDSVGPGRHAMEPPSDPRTQAKHDFARRLADILSDRGAAGAFDRLIIVAPPRALGDLRTLLAKSVQDKVTGELAKDLTKVPNDDLPSHLASVIAL